MKRKITVNLQGIKKWAWRKNLNGFFNLNGEPLSDAEVRKVVEYGIDKGYETAEDIPDEEIINLLNKN